MRRILTLFPILLVISGLLQAATPRDPEEYFFDQTFGDFSEELITAKEGGKQGILIMFEMDECPFCHRMKTTILNQPEIQDYFKQHFLIFSVDIEGDVEITDFQGKNMPMKDFAFKQFRVRATPVFQFFDLHGKPIKRARYTGASKNAQEFLLLGKFVAEQAYKNTNFTRYKRNHKNP